MHDDLLRPGEHTGFIAVEPSPSDWKNGGETGITGSPINASGDWRSSEPPGEWQRDSSNSRPNGTLFETDACVSFSANDVLETYGDYCLKNSLWTPEQMAWLAEKGYIDASGHLNFSDRFTAKMSGTTQAGNSLPAVWQSIKTNGLVPEAAWPNDFESLIPAPSVSGETQQNWDIYYAAIPAEIIALGKEFLTMFSIQYEWVVYTGIGMSPAAFASQLQQSPLQIATAVCSPWNTTDIIQGCGAGSQHATMLSAVDAQAYHILDHYAPFDKQFALNYVLSYAMRGILVPVAAPVAPAPFKHTFSTVLVLGNSSGEVVALQDALKADGDFPASVQSTGYYGSITQAAALKFQQKYQVDTPAVLTQLNGTRVGVKTIAQLNKLFGG